LLACYLAFHNFMLITCIICYRGYHYISSLVLQIIPAMSCQSEAHNHDHTHDHSHAHDLPSSDPNAGDKNSLYSKIDREHVRALNAAGGDEAGKNVIK
jgi:ABC-type nickel/cobalt efflux system permease component RcnA